MRKSGYKRPVAFLILSCALAWGPVSTAFAAGTLSPGYNGRMNNAVGGVIASKVGKQGFAANDPRIAATTTGAATGLTVLAMGIGTSVSWPALLVTAGVSALASGAVKLWENGGFTWLFGSNGSVTASGTVPGANASYDSRYGPLVKGGGYYSAVVSKVDYMLQAYGDSWRFYTTDALSAIGAVAGGFDPVSNVTGQCRGVTTGADAGCELYRNGNFYGSLRFTWYPTGSPVASANGSYSAAPPPPPVVIPPTTYATADEAVKAAPAAVVSEKLSPEVVAAAANAAWKAAAKEAGGIPWSASDPVTPADAAAWISSNPAGAPSVGDFFAPANGYQGSSGISIGGSSPMAPAGSGGIAPPTPAPSTEPGATPAPTPVPVTPGSGEEINWGPNPNIAAPVVEATPTAGAILDPIFNLMPSLKTFAVPAHTSECPVASFELFGQGYAMNSHCTLMEQNRDLIAASMMALFSLAAVMIVLKA